MNFDFSDDQKALREQASRFLRDRCPPKAVRRILEGGDLFDRDLVHTMLVDIGGKDVVVATGKGGVVVGLEPETGELVWHTPVGHHENDDLAELTGPTVVAPGTYGGVLTPPAAAD